MAYCRCKTRHQPTRDVKREVDKLLVGIGLSLAVYAAFVRPRILHWGATDEEINASFPGADLVPGGVRSGTMAVTIDAPPNKVWPWLIQMGYGRAGWYSWDYLDNFGRPSSSTLHPEWQNIEVGDYLSGPKVSELERRAWEVAALKPEQFLGLRSRIRGSESLWAFELKELPGAKTRLIVSGYWRTDPAWLRPILSIAFLEWAHWIMQMRQFAGLKRRAEQTATVPRPLESTVVP